LNDSYDFCPYCGNSADNSKKENWGMLGRNDFIPQSDFNEFPRGFNSLFNVLMKSFNKQLSELEKSPYTPNQTMKRSGIKIDISTSGNQPPRIRIGRIGEIPKEKQNKIVLPVFSPEKLKIFLSTPREEPKADVRRFSKRVIYEIELPGVKSAEDISMTKLESSIEIRAVSKGKSYLKIIPINFQITNYEFSDERLTIELKT